MSGTTKVPALSPRDTTATPSRCALGLWGWLLWTVLCVLCSAPARKMLLLQIHGALRAPFELSCTRCCLHGTMSCAPGHPSPDAKLQTCCSWFYYRADINVLASNFSLCFAFMFRFLKCNSSLCMPWQMLNGLSFLDQKLKAYLKEKHQRPSLALGK